MPRRTRPIHRPSVTASSTAVERAGNKLPQPFNLFLILFLLTGVVSTGLACGERHRRVPGSDDPIAMQGAVHRRGAGLVHHQHRCQLHRLPAAGDRRHDPARDRDRGEDRLPVRGDPHVDRAAPRWLLPYAVGFIGVVGSIMADSSFVVIPPLAAMAFKAAGRHPMAGLLGGFAAVGAGYSTSIFPTSLDALFAGITNAVVPTVPALEQLAAPVNPLSNYYYNVVSSVVLARSPA